jgi:hypothetical protein
MEHHDEAKSETRTESRNLRRTVVLPKRSPHPKFLRQYPMSAPETPPEVAPGGVLFFFMINLRSQSRVFSTAVASARFAFVKTSQRRVVTEECLRLRAECLRRARYRLRPGGIVISEPIGSQVPIEKL